MDGRTDTTDRITLPTNAVSKQVRLQKQETYAAAACTPVRGTPVLSFSGRTSRDDGRGQR